MAKYPMDLTGQKFGRLTVIKRAEDKILPSGSHKIQWECLCDCGNTKTILGDNLRRGLTNSCGCLRNEIASTTQKEYNTYDLSGKCGIGYTLKGEPFYFDLEDYDLIKDYCWYLNHDGYVVSYANKKHIRMHRLITNCQEGYIVDHIHGINTRNDNRKSNLRIGTVQQNLMNAKIRSNNSSGVTGVYFNRRDNKWIASIRANKIRKHLGSFKNFDDAVAARKEAEEKYFGEWSYDNSQNVEVA